MSRKAWNATATSGAAGDQDLILVLRRCALFYLASGYSESELVTEWSKALHWAKKQRVKAKIYRAGPVDQYRSICERWIRSPEYLNHAGNPIALPINGSRSVKGLMNELNISGNSKQVVAALEKIGSVRHVGNGKYLLVQKMFRTRPNSYVAYETFSQFLAHAVKAATMPLHNSKSDKHSHWLTATRFGLSETEIKKFVEFVKRRSQPQMLEIDDALNLPAKRRRPLKRAPKNIVGAGIFTFVTERNSP